MTATTTRLRATTAGAALVTRRRAAQDAALLTGSAVLLLATLVLTLAVPRLVERTADAAVRQTVQAAGTDADLLAVPPPDLLGDGSADPVDEAYGSAGWLTREFGDVTEPAVVALTSAAATVRTPVGVFAVDLVHVAVPQQDAPLVRWVAGAAPAPVPTSPLEAPPDPRAPRVVQVGLSAAAAAELGITLDGGPFTMRRQGAVRYDHVVVTGLYEPVDPQARVWEGHGGLLGAVTSPPGTATALQTSAYVPFDVLPDMLGVTGAQAVAPSARAAVRTAGMTLADAHALVADVEATSARSARLSSGLPAVVAAFDARMSAARAQASLVVAGVAAVATLCLVLAAALLVARRRPFLVTERARGASVASVVVRALAETVPVVLAAALLAVAAVTVWLPEHRGSVLLTVVVAVVAATAPAVLAARTAAAAWTGLRVPADRRERAARRARLGARRLVAETVVVVLAAAALVSVRGRGLVPLDAGEVDPLLAAAPVLLAAAAALLVVRVSPVLVRVTGRWAARSRGLVAPLAVARAQGATTGVVPLLTVTIGVALVVLSGTLVHTVRTGQQAAADQLVGAPVRLDGRLGTSAGAEVLERVTAAPGVTAVATGSQVGRRAFGERTGLTATLLVVDASELAEVRRAAGLPVGDLAALADPGAPGTVPALVDPGLLDRAGLTGQDVAMSVLDGAVRLDVRGPAPLPPDGGAPPLDARAVAQDEDDGLVVVDRARLAAVADRLPTVDRAWAAGPGAVDAVAAAGIAPTPRSGIVVTVRDAWWRAWSSGPITSALTALLVASVAVLTVLSVLALVLVVVATARERGRTLSALRTLGLDARTARWATLGELAPLAAGGVVGGVAIGLGVPALVDDALGLQLLTAEPGGAGVDVTWWPVAAAVGAVTVAVVVAVAVEQAVRRRDRLGEVLRVGER